MSELSGGKSIETSTGDSSGVGMEEWKSARDVFGKFDDRQHDLRKYGFTFLSALIAADSLTTLFKNTDDRIILTIIGITLLLTVALRLLDKTYELYMNATAIRAQILEVRLNMELTETISYRHETDKFDRYVLGVYMSFALVAGFVGFAVVFPHALLLFLILVFMIATFFFLAIIHRLTPNVEHLVDWSFDRTVCEEGEKVRIMATNLCKGDVFFEENKPVWAIHKEGQKEPLRILPQPQNAPAGGIVIFGHNNYVWELPTDKLPPGIYRVYPYHVMVNLKSKGRFERFFDAFASYFRQLLKKKAQENSETTTTAPYEENRWRDPLNRPIIILERKPQGSSSEKDKTFSYDAL